jgi:sec-independent protein translocase protein TatB
VFDIGFSELLLIGLLALLVLGPKRLPEVARTAGRWVARLRRFVEDVRQDFDRELRGEELKELRRLKEELDETRRIISESSSEIVRGLDAQVSGISETVTRAVNEPPTPPLAPPGTEVPAVEAPAPRAPARRQAARRARKPAARKKKHGRGKRAGKPRRR